MKFLIKKGTPTFEALTELFNEINRVREEARETARSLGFKGTVHSDGYLAGGIDGFIADQKPDGYREVRADTTAFYPKRNKANAELLDRIEKLPRIEHDRMNEIVGFKRQIVGLTMMRSVGCSMDENFALINMNEKAEFTPNADMEEITVSRYKELKKEIDDKRESQV